MQDTVLGLLQEIRPDFDFASGENFIESGFLDSFDMLTLINEVEMSFGVIISGLDIVPENFESVTAICSLIEKSEKR